MPKFKESTISDSKRLVRGEHWLAVRTQLRRRDWVHNAKWKIVTLAGGSPEGEINCLRALMPKAHIICVDLDSECCKAAIKAGADEVICGDLLDALSKTGGNRERSMFSSLPEQFSSIQNADAINIDLCGPVNDEFKTAIKRAITVVRKGAVLATFSYGRDVREVFGEGSYRGIPSPLGGRVEYIDGSYGHNSHQIQSALAYVGNAMPMCSLLWQPTNEGRRIWEYDIPFQRINDADLQLAVENIDVASLYALPTERITSFRRSSAARKAVQTRKTKQPVGS